MKIFTLVKILFKNLFFFIVGAIVGLAIVIKFVIPKALEVSLAEGGSGELIVGAVVLTPVFFIIYGILGIIIGGFGSIVIYNIVKVMFKKKKKA